MGEIRPTARRFERPPNMIIKRNRYLRKDYRHIKDPNKLYKQIALDHSNNGECWWVYNHIRNSFNYKY
jgi:hypothetical protein